MSSPLPVPDDCPIDLRHLRQSTFGDSSLEREVLGLFAGQAARLIDVLSSLPPEAGALTHTLKGSARAIGASRVAAAALAVEGAIRDGRSPAPALAELSAAVAEACRAIEAILQRS